MKRTIFLFALTLLVLTILAGGCSKDRATNNEGANSANVSVRLMKSSLAERVDLMRLSVYQVDLFIIQSTTTVVDGAFSFGGVVLPIGAYRFVVEGIDILPDDNQIIIYSGEDEVEIGAGSNPVTINVSPSVPMVRIGPYNLTTAETATFTSKVEIWNIPELRSGTILIPFDGTKVRFLNAAAANDGWGPLDLVAEVIDNQLELSFTRRSELDGVPIRHDIVDLSFTAIGAGDMTLAPAIVSLVDDEGNIPGLATVYEESQLVHIIGGGSGDRGVLTGYVYDATSGNNLISASVTITGPDSRQTVTDESGAYLFEDLQYGTYQVTASISGYIALARTVTHESPVTTSIFALSQQLAAGQYRIVLSWGATPEDLDSHFWTTIGDVIYEIYYGDQGSGTAVPFVLLDTDDVSGYGPETITVYQLSSTGIFAVDNYSEEPSITTSNAQIEVYSGNQKIANYSVPTTGEGKWWYVFDISPQGVITEHNTLLADPPVGTGKSPVIKAKIQQ